MGDTPKISDEVAMLAKNYLQGVADGTILIDGKDKAEIFRLNAAKDLYRAYQTQERYSQDRIKQLARTTNASQNVKEYDELDDDALNAKVIAIRGRQTG